MFKKWFGGSANRAPSSRIAFERTGEHVPGCPRGIYTIDPDGSDARQHPAHGPEPAMVARWPLDRLLGGHPR